MKKRNTYVWIMPYLRESNIFVAIFCVVSDNKTICMYIELEQLFILNNLLAPAVTANNRKVKVSFTD